MFNVRLAGDYLYGKWLFTWLSLVMSLMVSCFALSFFPRDVLGEIWDLIESVPDNFFYLLLLTTSISRRWFWPQIPRRHQPKCNIIASTNVLRLTPVPEWLGSVTLWLADRFPLLRKFSVVISGNPYVCFMLVQILISIFLKYYTYELGSSTQTEQLGV